ncbi:hypothetical protein [Haloquadratum walsbyi]|jgi:hypothetical protein|uniref:Uncharacterized protein n=1 Tax=Haloquadratum walsbyi J07HQW2 TaxID=1238425 RepID=U1NE85_9EURY|nr:hypothetical protein [Haloquadratum walsbyi]ERG95063.1 MAG: hypothetical protein J07HQW2_01508 [Haloquadratum walsbyi J07HQW2]
MSTNPRTTTQNQAESSTYTTAETSTSASYPQSLTEGLTTDTPWTQRCQRQFDTQSTNRLNNLVDKSNLVMISPDNN